MNIARETGEHRPTPAGDYDGTTLAHQFDDMLAKHRKESEAEQFVAALERHIVPPAERVLAFMRRLIIFGSMLQATSFPPPG